MEGANRRRYEHEFTVGPPRNYHIPRTNVNPGNPTALGSHFGTGVYLPGYTNSPAEPSIRAAWNSWLQANKQFGTAVKQYGTKPEEYLSATSHYEDSAYTHAGCIVDIIAPPGSQGLVKFEIIVEDRNPAEGFEPNPDMLHSMPLTIQVNSQNDVAKYRIRTWYNIRDAQYTLAQHDQHFDHIQRDRHGNPIMETQTRYAVRIICSENSTGTAIVAIIRSVFIQAWVDGQPSIGTKQHAVPTTDKRPKQDKPSTPNTKDSREKLYFTYTIGDKHEAFHMTTSNALKQRDGRYYGHYQIGITPKDPTFLDQTVHSKHVKVMPNSFFIEVTPTWNEHLGVLLNDWIVRQQENGHKLENLNRLISMKKNMRRATLLQDGSARLGSITCTPNEIQYLKTVRVGDLQEQLDKILTLLNEPKPTTEELPPSLILTDAQVIALSETITPIRDRPEPDTTTERTRIEDMTELRSQQSQQQGRDNWASIVFDMVRKEAENNPARFVHKYKVPTWAFTTYYWKAQFEEQKKEYSMKQSPWEWLVQTITPEYQQIVTDFRKPTNKTLSIVSQDWQIEGDRGMPMILWLLTMSAALICTSVNIRYPRHARRPVTWKLKFAASKFQLDRIGTLHMPLRLIGLNGEQEEYPLFDPINMPDITDIVTVESEPEFVEEISDAIF